VNGHLVPIKVGIKSGTDQGMDLDGIAIDQDRFKGLNAQAVQGRRAI